MKFNDKLYEISSSFKKGEEVYSSEELELEKKVMDIITSNIDSSKIEDGLVIIRFESKLWKESLEYDLICDLISRGLFNKLFNQYHIYIGNTCFNVNDYSDGFIEIIWDYKRYKEDMNSPIMKDKISEYELNKAREECMKSSHIFGEWDKYKVIKRVYDDSLEKGYEDVDNSYISRTCKRCGFTEKRFNSLIKLSELDDKYVLKKRIINQ